jgi:hypothetical protein
MVLVTELVDAHPLIRPLLGIGVLGGYTTFSTYTVDVITPRARRAVDARGHLSRSDARARGVGRRGRCRGHPHDRRPP